MQSKADMRSTICCLTAIALLFGLVQRSAAEATAEPAPVTAATVAAAAAAAPPRSGPAAKPPEASTAPADLRYYSDTFTPLRDDVRAYERDPANRYTYCIRNVGIYECLSYGSDGNIRRQQHRKVAHGTGFAYQLDGEETRLLTNQHVVAWPAVTDADHPVEDVPAGCKLISQSLSIVDNDDDEFEDDDIPLTKVLSDAALDVAVVRAKGKLRLLPYRVGHSSALSIGDVVIVRGFPLGVFQAYNTGKVINTYDRDVYKQWDHLDFIVDAQLSSGNSGSPVLALNRRTGEYELVGLFHASYTRANALNAVIAIDQLDDVMFKLKLPTRPHLTLDMDQLPDVEQRLRLQKALADRDFVPYLSLGPLLARVQPVGDNLLYEVFSDRFPLDDRRVAFLLDAPDPASWGKLSRVWLGGCRGYRAYDAKDLDAESADGLKRLLQRLRSLAGATLRYRQLMGMSHPDSQSRQVSEQRTVFQRILNRAAAQDSDLAAQLQEIATKRTASATGQPVSLGEVLTELLGPKAPPSLDGSPHVPQSPAELTHAQPPSSL